MREHISAARLEQFVKGDYPLASIVEMSKHLAQCFTCKEALNKLSPNFLDEVPEETYKNEEHFSDDKIIDFIKAELPVKHRLEMSIHFRNCQLCKAKLYEQDPSILRQSISAYLDKDELSEKKSFFQGLSLLIPVSAMAALLIGFTYFILFAGTNKNSSVLVKDTSKTKTSLQPSKTTEPDMFNSNDDDNVATQTRNGNSNTVKKLKPHPSKTETIAKNKKSTQYKNNTKQKPNTPHNKPIVAKNRSANPASDKDAGKKVIIISPSSKIVTESQPTFRWKPIPDAIKYDIFISDTSQILIERATLKKKTYYKPKTKLELNKPYKFKVIATLPNGKMIYSDSLNFSYGKTIRKHRDKK